MKNTNTNLVALKNLSREIHENWDVIEMLQKQMQDKIGEYLCECALQGQRLAPIKDELGHGNWMIWCEANHPGKYKLIQRCLRVAANWTYLSNLTEPAGLHRALAFLSEKSATESNEPPRRWAPYIEANLKLAKYCGYVERFPVQTWPPESQEAAREKLLPVAAALWPEKFA